jgi:hypothetical protein
MGKGDHGADVACLNRALAGLGYVPGGLGSKFTDQTAAGVDRWRASLGLDKSGSVGLGELVGFKKLPAVAKLGDDIVRARSLSGGEDGVFSVSGDLSFEIDTDSDGASKIPTSAKITVSAGGANWPAVISNSQTKHEDGADQVILTLTAPSGGVVCGNECGKVPAGSPVSLMAQVVVVPSVSGPTVPVSAVRTDSAGQGYVVMADGSKRSVDVLAASEGTAVVKGVSVGEMVRLSDPGAASASLPTAAVGAGSADTPDGADVSDGGGVAGPDDGTGVSDGGGDASVVPDEGVAGSPADQGDTGVGGSDDGLASDAPNRG